MEALAALSVAASAVQFVTFASSLVSNVAEINDSSRGTTGNVLSLEVIHKRLAEVLKALAPDSPPDSEAATETHEEESRIAPSTKAIRELARICGDDCERLLSVTKKLKARQCDGLGRQWVGFRVALKTLWKREEVLDLENRLARAQTTLILHICKVSG